MKICYKLKYLVACALYLCIWLRREKKSWHECRMNKANSICFLFCFCICVRLQNMLSTQSIYFPCSAITVDALSVCVCLCMCSLNQICFVAYTFTEIHSTLKTNDESNWWLKVCVTHSLHHFVGVDFVRRRFTQYLFTSIGRLCVYNSIC